jgi:hypothetical protein
MVIGIYGASLCIGSGKARIARNPERKHVSAPHRQRPDFSERQRTRRFSSLAAVSEKPENHFHNLALCIAFCNTNLSSRLMTKPSRRDCAAKHMPWL